MSATLIDWQRAAERGFGGLWDALGLRPCRELQQSLQRLATAQTEEVAAHAACLRVAASACAEGATQLALRLKDLQCSGEQLSSPIALMRLWLDELDGATHAAMLSEPGLHATAATVRAASRRRIEQQRIVALASEAAGVPTRADVDEAFREIQQLKRELRRLKRAAHAAQQEERP